VPELIDTQYIVWCFDIEKYILGWDWIDLTSSQKWPDFCIVSSIRIYYTSRNQQKALVYVDISIFRSSTIRKKNIKPKKNAWRSRVCHLSSIIFLCCL